MLQRHNHMRRIGTALAAVLVVGVGRPRPMPTGGSPLPFKDGFESGVTTAFARKGIDGTGTVSVTTALVAGAARPSGSPCPTTASPTAPR